MTDALTPQLLPPAPATNAHLPIFRTRLALALASLVGVALELTLMRGLALRFWSHFACMVISVGLLGFGAAGSMLTLFRPAILRHQQAWLAGLLLALAVAIPLTWWGSQKVPLDVGFLAWSFSQSGNVLVIELLMFIPFLLIGSFVGVALMDRPERISGHYASDLVGSGAGGLVAVLAMHVLSVVGLMIALCVVAFLAALLLVPWKNQRLVMASFVVLAAICLIAALMPWESAISPYKILALARTFPGTEEIYHTEGPLGQIDVLEGPSLHDAPAVSLQYTDSPPIPRLLITDGDGSSPVYDIKNLNDWKFLDYRTAAAPFHLRAATKLCIVGAGGGAEIGLALYHHTPDITALEMNPQIIATMTGPLASLGGSIYNAAGVHMVNKEARGYFAATRDTFDIIQLPPIDGFGASGAGLYATQENYLYTVESMREMLHHLNANGILSVTRWVRTPPREELRTFDMLAQALKAENLDPATHLAMLRSPFTCTVLAFKSPIHPEEIAGLQDFCGKQRGFDICYLPGLTLAQLQAHVYHKVDHQFYFEGPRALLENDRAEFLANYPFDITAPTDDRPYFFHSFRFQALAKMKEQLGAGSNAFLEMGYIMLLVALAQTILLGLILMLLPLAPGIRSLRHTHGKTVCLTYFLMLGLGFMLLEMGFVQKLTLYLAHPIYSAAVVIGSFLVFAGLGSNLSTRWPAAPKTVIATAVGTILVLSALYLTALDRWLDLTESFSVAGRCTVAALTIAPLAFAMGHLFPLGLTRTAHAFPQLVPFAWAVNGFSSVVATAAAPLLAMRFGFTRLALTALACYLLAALVFRLIPEKHKLASAIDSLVQPVGAD